MKKISKIICFALCLMLLLFAAACDGGGNSLSYSGSSLEGGTVGVSYLQSVATATGADGIIYTLKSGSTLPDGLRLTPAGNIEGIPEKKAAASTFTVEAYKEGYTSAEAQFSITIGQGTITYTGTTLNAVFNVNSTLSVATAKGAVDIEYSITGDLPSGLAFDSNGTITGTATALDEEKIVTVTASAVDCASAQVQFTIKVVLPLLTFENATLPNGTTNQIYGAQLPFATGASNGITYAIKAGTLPAGLTLSGGGYVGGTPTVAVSRHTFTVTASAAGYTSADAVFTITIILGAEGSYSPGTITFNVRDLNTAYVSETYFMSQAARATSDNRAPVTVKLAEGSTLPSGFELSATGDLRCESEAVAAGDFNFDVVASAENCSSVTRTLTLTVEPEKLVYAGTKLEMATVGEVYSMSLATAEKKDGTNAGIAYTVNVTAADELPTGLSFAAGQLSGIPAKSAKQAMFAITASATGFSSVTAYFFLHIRDAITTVPNGIFEAEFIDLAGIHGEGWSGSALEEAMVISAGPQALASNNLCVGWTFNPNTFTFNITSKAVVTGARLILRLGSEAGTMTITPAAFEIRVNGVSMPYSSFQLQGIDTNGVFQDFTVTNGLNLVAGENKIELIIHENEVMDGRTFGPVMDCLKIENFGSVELSWRPCKYNTGQ